MGTWGFLTNHAHVTIQIARNPRATVREIALGSGITERATISVLHDLRGAGIVSSKREGRQNVNEIDFEVLAAHRPWGASNMDIPEPLIEATLQGLARLVASRTAATGAA